MTPHNPANTGDDIVGFENRINWPRRVAIMVITLMIAAIVVYLLMQPDLTMHSEITNQTLKH